MRLAAALVQAYRDAGGGEVDTLDLLGGRRAIVLATSHVYAPGVPPGLGRRIAR
jgi:hypothetical protein